MYLLLEFQSRTNPFMAVRILSYVGLLYQELVRGRQLAAHAKLPPVLPLVLYNGAPRWRAATEVADLVATVPGGLERYRPRTCYLLLDEGALADSDLPPVRNLAGALFRLERSRLPDDVRNVVTALAEWLGAPEQAGLRRAFTVWIRRVLLPARLAGVAIPEVADLQEVRTMLAERVIDWTRDWKELGIEEGRKEGRMEGRQEGEAAILHRLLVRRFGDLPEAVAERVRLAAPEQIERWSDRLFDATTLDEIFAGD